jgi:hypothetical protein
MADYSPLRRSTNIDDRRETSEAAEWARALLAASAAAAAEEPVPPSTPLGRAAGIDDIVRSHGLWLLRQAFERQPRTFEERLPQAPTKFPFGLGG